MILDNSSLLLLSAPAAMLLVSLAANWRPGLRPALVGQMGIGAAAFSIYVAAIGGALLINHGPMHSTFLAWQGIGFSVQLDPLSVLIFAMVALVAFYFVRLCRTFMDGDPRQHVFLGRLSAMVGSVQLLVLTGNLAILIVASILTGLTLRELLVFYRKHRGVRATPASDPLGSLRGNWPLQRDPTPR